MYKIPETAKRQGEAEATPKKAKAKDGLTAWERWELPQIDSTHTEDDIALARAQPGKKVLRPITLDELEKIRSDAYQEGFVQGKQDGFNQGKQEGYQTGFNQGLSAGEAEVKANLAKFSQLTRLLMQPIESQEQEIEQTMVSLVGMLAKQIVRRELELNSNGVLSCVREALNHISLGAKRVKLHLNPADHEMVLQYLKASAEYDANWRLIPHKTLSAGGCIVETDEAILDLSVERRCEDLLKQFYEKAKGEKSEQPADRLDQLLSGDDDDEFSA